MKTRSPSLGFSQLLNLEQAFQKFPATLRLRSPSGPKDHINWSGSMQLTTREAVVDDLEGLIRVHKFDLPQESQIADIPSPLESDSVAGSGILFYPVFDEMPCAFPYEFQGALITYDCSPFVVVW